MIRCRQCNSELTEQARFCKVCGLPQKHQEPELEKSTQNGAEILDTNSSDHCANCGAEIPRATRFCPKCGAFQSFKEAPASTRTSGLIPPITPKSSSRPVFPSRPEVNGQPTSNPQPIQTPESSLSTSPATLSSPFNKQMQKPSSSVLMELKAESRDKQQIVQQLTHSAQNYTQAKIDPNRIQNLSQQQTVYHRATSDKPLLQDSSTYDSEELSSRSTPVGNGNGKHSISDSPSIDLLNPASFMATSKAAEQWRKSWRDRQYAEVGPAEIVSRGQASVPTPLTSMQQSFLRMRAIQKSKKEQQGKRTVNLGTWITIFLMICLIIGLGAYVIMSYFPSSPFATQTSTSSNNTVQPKLALVGTAMQTVTTGRSLQLRGTQFGDNQTIIFLRDTATPIMDSSGKNISTRTDSQGTFVVTIPIDNSWSVGSHPIEALDKSSNQNAFLTIQVIPAGTTTTSSADLSITMEGKSVSQLNLTSVMGQSNPASQQIIITNTSGSPLQWTATASTNNLNWLQINDNSDYGQLAISQPHAMLISVNTTGLKTTDKNHPYRGQIIFTINNTQLLTLPVQLQIVDATPEMVFSPNPISAPIGPGNTCQVGVTLTLINLGSAAISWAVNPDLTDKIKFVSNGQLLESGTLLPSGSLLPSGQPGDTIVLTLQCNDIKLGQSYHVSVYANQFSWSESVIITNK